MRIIVTGGAGFIGSAVVRHVVNETGHEVLVLDKLRAHARSHVDRAIRRTRSMADAA